MASEEMSVNRLVRPRARTTPGTLRVTRSLRDGVGATPAAGAGAAADLGRWARGVKSLVKVTPGPRNTSSATVTPAKTMTWFLTVTRLPMTAPDSTNAPSQTLQSVPIRAPSRTWANAQTLV